MRPESEFLSYSIKLWGVDFLQDLKILSALLSHNILNYKKYFIKEIFINKIYIRINLSVIKNTIIILLAGYNIMKYYYLVKNKK